MMKARRVCLMTMLCCITLPAIARAQDTSPPGVRLGLNYAAGSKPGVIVLPVQDIYDDDSLRTIVQRDLDYGDRMNVIALGDEELGGTTPPWWQRSARRP